MNFSTSFSGSVELARRPPLFQFTSFLLWSHDGTSNALLEIQQLQHPALGSLRPPQDLTIRSPALMWPTHKRIFLKTSICVFQGGKLPTREG